MEGLIGFLKGSLRFLEASNIATYCNSLTSKLLLYDYLPGGSLDQALHERGEQLDWDSRVNIIIGAAKGVAYLHHDCSPRIIHRDIKSSNILLDGNLEARVSDFGLAKLLGDEESHITTIVAGTFGYLAPEYMQSGRATEKTDVYSFGVLILEVLSGKLPTDKKGYNVVGWVSITRSSFDLYPPLEDIVGQCGPYLLPVDKKWITTSVRRGLEVCRIDGSVKLDERRRQIQEFNDEKSNCRICLLSTRAGGLGINLTAADTCILYVSDWVLVLFLSWNMWLLDRSDLMITLPGETEGAHKAFPVKGPGWEVVLSSSAGGMLSSLN
ncbi:hypothetical protein F2Q70_00030882, partial [Brassica cretica]